MGKVKHPKKVQIRSIDSGSFSGYKRQLHLCRLLFQRIILEETAFCNTVLNQLSQGNVTVQQIYDFLNMYRAASYTIKQEVIRSARNLGFSTLEFKLVNNNANNGHKSLTLLIDDVGDRVADYLYENQGRFVKTDEILLNVYGLAPPYAKKDRNRVHKLMTGLITKRKNTYPIKRERAFGYKYEEK